MSLTPSAIDGRGLAALCVAALVVLAGCGAVPGGGGGDGGGDDDPTSTTTAADTSGAAGTTAGDGTTDTGAGGGTTTGGAAPTTTAGGSDDPGETLSEAFVERWADRLRSAGSFTLDMRGISVRTSGGAGGGGGGTEQPLVDWTIQIDLSTGEQYANGTISGGGGTIPIELYHPPNSDTTYTRTVIGGEPRFSETDDGQDRENPVDTGLLNAVELTRDGTETIDGERLVRYTAQGTESITDTAYFEGSVTSLQIAVFVDTDAGLIRAVDYEYEVERPEETVAQSLRIEYNAIGETTVERPDWVDQAAGGDAGALDTTAGAVALHPARSAPSTG